MIKIDLPLLGTVDRCAAYLIEKRDEVGEPVEADFNGTPMTAGMNDTETTVQICWHYERLLIQIHNGVVDVSDYVDKRYIREKRVKL